MTDESADRTTIVANPLADDIRNIAADSEANGFRRRLYDIADRIDWLPTESTVHELTADVGLTGEQQIRAIALEIAYRHLLHDAYEVADEAAAYIRDGSRP